MEARDPYPYPHPCPYPYSYCNPYGYPCRCRCSRSNSSAKCRHKSQTCAGRAITNTNRNLETCACRASGACMPTPAHSLLTPLSVSTPEVLEPSGARPQRRFQEERGAKPAPGHTHTHTQQPGASGCPGREHPVCRQDHLARASHAARPSGARTQEHHVRNTQEHHSSGAWCPAPG